MVRKHVPAVIGAALLLGAAVSLPSFGQTLRVAMTASDIPTTSGIPNNGGEGFRFLGFPAFDGLIDWDYTRPDQIAGLTPGLAASWKIDDSDHTRWVFSLREGVKFHDGSEVTADAVIWNLDRLYNEKSLQFDAPASAIVRSFVNMLDRYQKIDDRTIAIYTKSPFSFFPYMVPTMLMVSPTQWEKAGRSWTEFAKAPSGTGPFRITKVVPGQSVEMSRNEAYWDKNRIQADRDPDAGGDHTSRRPAVGSGRLDRGPAARCDSLAEGGGVSDQLVALSAHLAVYFQRGRGVGVSRHHGNRSGLNEGQGVVVRAEREPEAPRFG